jgi:hypothetical protein
MLIVAGFFIWIFITIVLVFMLCVCLEKQRNQPLGRAIVQVKCLDTCQKCSKALGDVCYSEKDCDNIIK